MDEKEAKIRAAVLTTGEWIAKAVGDYLYDHIGSKGEEKQGTLTLTGAILGTLEERGFGSFPLQATMRDFLLEFLIAHPEKAEALCKGYLIENDEPRLLEAGVPRFPWHKQNEDQSASKVTSMWQIGICESERDGKPYEFVRMEEVSSKDHRRKIDLHLNAIEGEMAVVFSATPTDDYDGKPMALSVPMLVFTAALDLVKQRIEEKEES